MFNATIKGLLAHKLRLALTALSIVLGVAFVSGTYILSDTITRTFDDLFAEITKGVDLQVRTATGLKNTDTGSGEERDPVPASLLSTVRGIPGVAKAGGDVAGYAQIVDKKGKAVTTGGAPTIGVVWTTDLDESPLSVKEGRPPARPDEMGMDATTADKHDFQVGDRVKVLHVGSPREYTLVGIMRFGSQSGLAGATLSVFDLATGQQVFDKAGKFDAINVQLADGADAAEVERQLEAALPEPVEVLTGQEVADEDAASTAEFIGIFSTVLLVFAGVALFVGGFIIVNTFNILVAQRSRELALLRAMGAHRRQVIWSVVTEAAVVGLVASVIGIGLGFLVAVGIQALFRAAGLDLPATGTVFLPRTAIAGFVVGVGVTVVAALTPARRAAKVPPVAAMREEIWTAPPASLRRRSIVGGLLTGGGLLALGVGLFGSTDGALQIVGLGAALLFLGITTLSPLLAAPVAGFLGRPFARFRGTPGRLGRENAMRNPRRTSATAAALMVGLALVGAVSVLAQSTKASAGDVIDKSLGADYVIASNFFLGHSPALAKTLRDDPAVGVVAEARSGPFKAGGDNTFLSGMDPATLPQTMKVTVVQGSLDAIASGAILVEEDEAKKQGYTMGGPVDVEFGRTGKKQLTLGGIYERNDLLGTYLVSIPTFDANFTQRLNVVTLVNRAAGADASATRAAIDRALLDYPNLTARDQTELKAEQRKQINQVLAIVFGLLLLAILIAFFGIVNTLALSVYERTRELGLLRAVGMSRKQVRQMIRYEAVLIALLGAVLGLAVGIGLGTALVTALKDDGITKLAVPVGLLLFFIVLAALAGVVAALLPARRAARMNVLAAISHS